MKKIFLIFFYLTGHITLAQGEANIWYFGAYAGLDFNGPSPTVLTNGSLITDEGCTSISNASGQLLLYTDGRTVYNKLHQVMDSGTGLMGHISSSQSALIVPWPNNPNKYYIFTAEQLGGFNGIRYSIVDMLANGGLGKVFPKNIPLLTPACEKLAAVKNAAGDGFWLLAHGYGDAFYAYSVMPTGINTTPVASNGGAFINGGNSTIGCMKFSPEGSKVAICNFSLNAELFDFNDATGAVTNPRILNTLSRGFGCEFSASGKMLYLTSGPSRMDRLFQYDTSAADVAASETLIYTHNDSETEIASLQSGPDGKIYTAIHNSTYVGIINAPESSGTSCNYQPNAINLGMRLCKLGLPGFVQSYFASYITATHLCLGETTLFSLQGLNGITNVSWDFGDSNGGLGLNASHQYANPGLYTVSVTYTDIGGVRTKTKQVLIAAAPVIANPINSQTVCGSANMNYGLSQFTSQVLGGQPTTYYDVVYFSSQTDLTSHINVLPAILPLSLGTTTFYVKVFNKVDRNCFASASFSVTLSQMPIANAVTDFVICENAPFDGIEQFDLSVKNSEVLNGQNPSAFVVSYHTSQYNAEHGIGAFPSLYTNILPQEILYVRIQSLGNPDCYATTILNIKVVQLPVISPVSDFVTCDDVTNDGITPFDLSQKTTEVLGGQSPVVFKIEYYLSQQDAIDGVNEINSPISNITNPQTVYFSIAAIGNAACRQISSFRIAVSSLPKANSAHAIFICDDASNDGVGNFSLDDNTPIIIGLQDSSQFTVSYHLNQSDADTGNNALAVNYQNITNPQTIFARIENNQNRNCFATTNFQIGLHKVPAANQPDNMLACDDEMNDGLEIFDLTSQNPSILGNQSAIDFTVTYHTSLNDAGAGINALPSNFVNTSNPQTVFARLSNNLSPACYGLTSFSLIIKTKPLLELMDSYSICEGSTISITAPEGFNSYSWSNGSSVNTTTITQAGDYSLTVTKDYGDIICNSTRNIKVYKSSLAAITKVETIDWTDDQNTIAVMTTGEGDYEYSINGVDYQDSSQFYNLRKGEYTIFVRDKKGCGITTGNAFLLMYSRFFTPNNDGINDLWKVRFSINEPGMLLYIFDRDGRLVTGFAGIDYGWDGSFNGNPLPSSDYWFVIRRQNGKEYRGHFSLVR